MIFVIFEVTPKEGRTEEYLNLADQLKDDLQKTDGFIRSERFSSLTTKGKILSLSAWESEEAVDRWRNNLGHQIAQKQGRNSIFESYSITVVSQLRHYTDKMREEAPKDNTFQYTQQG